ncbi:MAG TPA: ribulose phosphate epimerase, partial [Cellvibrionaceae bacterium]|nr:ribulose phosphate epimerase [Cellvibrionaceae bacterium]
MKRRTLLGYLGLTGLGIALPSVPCRVWAASSAYKGLLYINLQASGGWDVTSFCDPKINQPNEKIINNWATTAEVQKAGNIAYAPVGNNARFFK